jgi:hypothetical protein
MSAVPVPLAQRLQALDGGWTAASLAALSLHDSELDELVELASGCGGLSAAAAAQRPALAVLALLADEVSPCSLPLSPPPALSVLCE